jgi:hypothetical protein
MSVYCSASDACEAERVAFTAECLDINIAAGKLFCWQMIGERIVRDNGYWNHREKRVRNLGSPSRVHVR